MVMFMDLSPLGFEHGVGIFVSEVDPDSQAYHYGLRVSQWNKYFFWCVLIKRCSEDN